MCDEEGVNFSIYSEHADYVELLLFDKHDDLEPVLVLSTNRVEELTRPGKVESLVETLQEIETSQEVEIVEAAGIALNKTFHFWHVYVRGLKPGVHYAYRIGGPFDPSGGYRFDGGKVLIDPYSRGNNKTLWDREKASVPGDNLATSMRSVVIDSSRYRWEHNSHIKAEKVYEMPGMGEKLSGKSRLQELNETVIYELHVGGFTRSPTSGVRAPGTFSGIIEKIPYLKDLGITAVELMPVFDFDDTISPEGKRHYWGYDPICFFAPHSGYCENPERGDHTKEFRDMVKALHKAGIEVILDVVFNHTSEGNHLGPVFSFKGIDNSIYYHLEPDRQYYSNYSGCGNTVNCNHPISQKLIVDCLKYWTEEMHVDGFRFDQGSILSLDTNGKVMKYPPVIWQIELDDALGYIKVIAEAWDAAALNQVGYFPGPRWAEWNGYYRDEIRRFVRGDPGLVGRVASRIAGSPDLYQSESRLPINSVNFVTCHDGFTLNDLVSYNYKHNEANGENNRDGTDSNLSWNCGAEGETDVLEIEALRERQIKNFATILLLSVGVPMISMGDEVRRTQKGNNNAYCQDNETGWFDWNLVERNRNMFRFWKLMIDFRKRHTTILRPRYFTGKENERGLKDISWHGCKLYSPGWDDPYARALSFTMGEPGDEEDIHVMMNMYWEPLEFEIPELKGTGRSWYRAIDTFLSSPLDIAGAGEEIRTNGNNYLVQGRSVVVLISKWASEKAGSV
ncbi:glycogen debranching protein GlgX [Methanosarcina sp. T3]|uniref:glycogen debranching protein GlgX n=1 Tax=Methanosarcina sp. T3 TaxID=3439062 RepID=UPI003F84C497